MDLLDLPLIVIRLILDLLQRKHINAFGLVSRACRWLTEPIIFRTVVLHDCNPFSISRNERICNRIRNSEDALSEHVRDFRIGHFKQDSHLPCEQTLVDVLTRLQHLLDFFWNADFKIPEAVLTTLSTKWPAARLHVSNFERNERDPGGPIPLDIPLLSSPQLYSLKFTVCGSWNNQPLKINNCYSEFAALSNCLVKGGALKQLSLRTHMFPQKQDCWEAGPNNLQFLPGSVFPPLEELSLPHEKYRLSKGHFDQWLVTMDWGHLRRLDIRRGCPQHLFVALTGRVPQLKSITFGFWYPRRSFELGFVDLEIIRRFFDSTQGLEEIVVESFRMHYFDSIKDQIFDKHGRTLRKVHVDYSMPGNEGWKCEVVQKLVDQCPGLRHLALMAAMEVENSVGTSSSRRILPGHAQEKHISTVWPKSTMDELKRLRYLRSLEVYLLLDKDSDCFMTSSEGKMFLIEKAALESATCLFSALLETTAIESAKVRYMGYLHKGWDFTVTQQNGRNSDFEVEKRFVIDGVPFAAAPIGTGFNSLN